MRKINLGPIIECNIEDLLKNLIRYEVDCNGKVILSRLNDFNEIEYLTYTTLDTLSYSKESTIECTSLVDITE